MLHAVFIPVRICTVVLGYVVFVALDVDNQRTELGKLILCISIFGTVSAVSEVYNCIFLIRRIGQTINMLKDLPSSKPGFLSIVVLASPLGEFICRCIVASKLKSFPIFDRDCPEDIDSTMPCLFLLIVWWQCVIGVCIAPFYFCLMRAAQLQPQPMSPCQPQMNP